MLVDKLKADHPDEFAEFEKDVKLQAMKPLKEIERTVSFGGASNSSHQSKQSLHSKHSKITASTAITSTIDCPTPTKFRPRQSTDQGYIAEPVCFLNVDDEEEVRRSK